MIDRLDRYVARYFVAAWFVSLVFFVGLFGVYDFFSQVGDFVERLGDEQAVSTWDIARLYALEMPRILLQVAPFVMVSAALVTLMLLQRHNEFAAMVLTGRSPRRVLRAVVALTVVFVGVLVFVQEVVAPAAAAPREALRAHVSGGEGRIIERVQIMDTGGKLIVVRDYDAVAGVVALVGASFVDEAGRDVHISGENARWDEAAGGWLLENGTMVTRVGTRSLTDPAPFLRTDVRPEDLMAQAADPFDLSYARILERSERYPRNRNYRLLRHYHFTFPLGILAIVLLAVPFVLHTTPNGRLRGLGVSILFVLGYLVLDLGVRELGRDGAIQPVVAAWIPVIVTGSLVVVLHDGLE